MATNSLCGSFSSCKREELGGINGSGAFEAALALVGVLKLLAAVAADYLFLAAAGALELYPVLVGYDKPAATRAFQSF